MILIIFCDWILDFEMVLQIEQKISSRRKISYIHYLLRILLTQPCDTCSCRLISQGRMPCKANCRIWTLKWSGKGRPFVNSLPYWFIFLPPTSSWKKKNLTTGISLLKLTIILNHMKFLKKLYAHVCNQLQNVWISLIRNFFPFKVRGSRRWKGWKLYLPECLILSLPPFPRSSHPSPRTLSPFSLVSESEPISRRPSMLTLACFLSLSSVSLATCVAAASQEAVASWFSLVKSMAESKLWWCCIACPVYRKLTSINYVYIHSNLLIMITYMLRSIGKWISHPLINGYYKRKRVNQDFSKVLLTVNLP